MSDSADTILGELARAIETREGGRAEFARAVGIGQVYLSQILSGKRPLQRLPLSTARKISAVSGVPLDRLAAVSAPPIGGAE